MDDAYVRKNKKGGKKGLVASLLKGLVFSIIFGAAVLFVFCAVAMKFDDPDKVSPICGVAAMLLTAFFGGLVTAKSHCERGFSSGLLFGVLMVLILAVISLLSGAKISTAAFSILAPVAVLAAALGGVIGTSGKKPRKKKRREF